MTHVKQRCWARLRFATSVGVLRNSPLCGTQRAACLTRDPDKVTCPKCHARLEGGTS
jgi:hypothetical protein